MNNRHLFTLSRRLSPTRYFPSTHLRDIFCATEWQIKLDKTR